MSLANAGLFLAGVTFGVTPLAFSGAIRYVNLQRVMALLYRAQLTGRGVRWHT